MEQLLHRIDTDGDGQISYQEFLKYFGKGSAEDKNVLSTVGPPPYRGSRSQSDP